MKYLISIAFFFLFNNASSAQHPFPYLENIYTATWMNEQGITAMTLKYYPHYIGHPYPPVTNEYSFHQGNIFNDLFKILNRNGHHVSDYFCKNYELFNHDQINKEQILLEGSNFFYAQKSKFINASPRGVLNEFTNTKSITQNFKEELEDNYRFKEFSWSDQQLLLATTDRFYDQPIKFIGYSQNDIINKTQQYAQLKEVNYTTEQETSYQYNEQQLVTQIKITVHNMDKTNQEVYYFTIHYDHKNIPREILEYKSEIDPEYLISKRVYQYKQAK